MKISPVCTSNRLLKLDDFGQEVLPTALSEAKERLGIMLSRFLSSGPLPSQDPQHLVPFPLETPCEALFLQSLQEGAAGFGDNRWSELELACRSELNMDEETFKFLLQRAKEYRRTKEKLAKLQFKWTSRLGWSRKFSGRPRIVLVLAEGQAIRTFLLTDACKKLAVWADLFILSQHDVRPEVAALGPHAYLLPIPTLRRSRIDYLVGYLGYLQTEGPTTRRFVERLDENLQSALHAGSPIQGNLRIWQVASAYRSPEDHVRLYSWSLKLFANMYSLKIAASLLRMIAPTVIVNTSSVGWSSRLWTRAAALEGLRIVSNVISWDNMSTKTLLDEFADVFLIWSDEMEEDFTTNLPFVRNKRRVIVGSPQFEPIVKGEGLVARERFLQRYGLSPHKKLILYTTGSTSLFPREADCLDRLLSHWSSNLRDRTNLMVRLHPKDRQGRYKEVIAKFPDIPFTFAGETMAQDEEWVPKREDIELLVNQLHHCDVIINVASTMTLEGFAVDKPCINIGFSLGPSRSARYPMEDYYKSRHYRDVVDGGAARLVANYEELFEAIEDVLDRQLFDVNEQRRVLRMKCKYTQDASGRINDFLASYINSMPRDFVFRTDFVNLGHSAVMLAWMRLDSYGKPIRKRLAKLIRKRLRRLRSRPEFVPLARAWKRVRSYPSKFKTG